nr:Mor transcription activator family protein [Candidatus Hamiltonella defensa]
MAHWRSPGTAIDNRKVSAFKGGGILTNLLQEMTDLLGPALTCKLGQSMGGARVYIPKKIQANDPLALLLGGQDAERLCAYYAGTVLDLPSKYFFRAVRNHHIRQDYHSGNLTGSRADHLALKYGLSRRQVLNVIKRA